MGSERCCSDRERQEQKAGLEMMLTAAAGAADGGGVHDTGQAGLEVAAVLASDQSALQAAGIGKKVDVTLAGQTYAHDCPSVGCCAEASLQLKNLYPFALIHHSAGLILH